MKRASLLVALLFLAPWLGFGKAEAHLFHFQNVKLQETWISSDYLLLIKLIDLGAERFELAEEVWTGHLKSKPKNPYDPGFILKANYQRKVRIGSLRELALKVDQERGTRIVEKVERTLRSRDVEGVKAAFREFFFHQILELFEAMERAFKRPEVSSELFAVAQHYFSVAFEYHLLTSDRMAYVRLKRALEELQGSLGTSQVPPNLEKFKTSKKRVLGLLRGAVEGH